MHFILLLSLPSQAVSKIYSSFALLCALHFTAFLILFALLPKRRVDKVSLSLYRDMEQVMTRQVEELPPRDS